MTEFTGLLQQGTASAWLFIPSAILLGALHGLEPGHSKTMMAAFIVSIRGTLTQAVLLGLAATVSHTAVVWVIALGGMYFGQRWSAQASEPYLQLASAVLIIATAAWMIWRTWRQQLAAADHDHLHDHRSHHLPHHHHGEPLGTDGGHRMARPDMSEPGYQDPHELAHANDIRRRFANREVSTGQIVVFGLTGGLIPCPASITVLLLCLQLKEITLGAVLVLSFSIGLALTMVLAGALAALSMHHAAGRWTGFGAFARRAPYVSGGVILLVGIYLGCQGYLGMVAG